MVLFVVQKCRWFLVFWAGFSGLGVAWAQPPEVKPIKDHPPPKPLDETKLIVREIEEAYKAPLEVDKDVLNELRQQYKKPSPDREAKLFYEIRRLYQTTPTTEEAILREVREAYEAQTPEQEKRVFTEIHRNATLPLGTVHPLTRLEHAGKLFRKLDRNGNSLLSDDEVPEILRSQMPQWDRNRDGVVDTGEYQNYYLALYQSVAEGVAAGTIPIKLPKGVPGPGSGQKVEEEPKPTRHKDYPPGLPSWFAEFDTDGDGQVGLYEWRRRGRIIMDFLPIDRNNDGYITPAEMLTYIEKTPGAGVGKIQQKRP